MQTSLFALATAPPMTRPTTMPFGKFKGKPIAKLPLFYIQWLLKVDLRPALRTALEEEIEARWNGTSQYWE